MSTRTISLLTTDIRKLIGTNRDIMEEDLKSFNIEIKVLAQLSNAMWDILFRTEEAAKSLTGSTLTTKTVRL